MNGGPIIVRIEEYVRPDGDIEPRSLENRMPVILVSENKRKPINLSPMYRNENFKLGKEILTYSQLRERVRVNPGHDFEVSLLSEKGASASAVQRPVQTTRVKVHAYTPQNENHLKARSALARLRELKGHVQSLSDGEAPDFFLAPEYYFNWAQDGDSKFRLNPSSIEERDRIVAELQDLSGAHPEMVVIAGTIVWYEASDHSSSDESKPSLRNSAFVFRNGERLKSANLDRYDKAITDYETTFLTTDKYRWTSGGMPRFDFEHKGLQCRLAICSDADCILGEDDKEQEKIDLQLIVASRFGQKLRPNTHMGGWYVLADGDGWSRAVKRVPVSAAHPTSELGSSKTFDIEVEKEVKESEPAAAQARKGESTSSAA
jgi:hypothetical protein